MDWIETTGKTIEDAKEAALDELGVDEEDAEFEVVAEAKSGLFGRVREEARIRARVRPTTPRPKEERRDRRRRPAGRSTEAADAPTEHGGDDASSTEAPVTAVAVEDRPAVEADAGPRSSSDGGGRRRSAGRAPAREASDSEQERGMDSVVVPLEEQAGVAKDFVAGLVHQFGLSGEVTFEVDEAEGVIDVAVEGDALGLLIGPKGATLLAIQDLARSAVQQATGAGNGRLNVDVSGYRAKRMEALARFAERVAEQVRSTGTRQALEPMTAADRKVIHDALTNVEGVSTTSEGEDAARRVVIVPTAG